MDTTTKAFETALTTFGLVIEEHWHNLTADQRKVMRQIESIIEDETNNPGNPYYVEEKLV